MLRLGIDTGGTHTDLILVDDSSKKVFSTKTLTTPQNMVEGIMLGVEKILELSGMEAKEIGELIYGTTLAVNMIAQHESEKTALITTKGFRDVLEIGRAYRSENIYDIYMDKPVPLINRELRFGVQERINFCGDVVEDLDEDEVKQIVHLLKAQDINSIAVCLLHSYVNSIHEERIRDIIKREWPEAFVSLSSEINPEFREYERTSTTVINAYVMPKMTSHLQDFKKVLAAQQMEPGCYIMQCNAGVMTFDAAIKKPVYVIDSGPIAGAVAGSFIGKLAGFTNIITLDIGGTSCDISLIQDGGVKYTTKHEVEGFPVSIPTVDLSFIGAGGGSIAWLDAGGALKVGPRSAGSLPGPVCYLRGGTEPTVTDANLVVGRISTSASFLGANKKLDVEAAQKAILEKIAQPLGLELLEAAEGILKIANANMIGALKVMSVARGYDPRDFVMVAFGGGGGLHAAKLAEELEIPQVIVPYSPGTVSAMGLVLADIKHDYVCTKIQSMQEFNVELVNQIFSDLEAKGVLQLVTDEVPGDNRILTRTCDIRYLGQAFELSVGVSGGCLTEKTAWELAEEFHRLHERVYGHAMKEDPIEFVNYRVSAIGRLTKPDFSTDREWKTQSNMASAERTIAIFEGQHYNCEILDRNSIKLGTRLKGPAIVGEMGGTTVIYPGQHAVIDHFGNIIIHTNS